MQVSHAAGRDGQRAKRFYLHNKDRPQRISFCTCFASLPRTPSHVLALSRGLNAQLRKRVVKCYLRETQSPWIPPVGEDVSILPMLVPEHRKFFVDILNHLRSEILQVFQSVFVLCQVLGQILVKLRSVILRNSKRRPPPTLRKVSMYAFSTPRIKLPSKITPLSSQGTSWNCFGPQYKMSRAFSYFSRAPDRSPA